MDHTLCKTYTQNTRPKKIHKPLQIMRGPFFHVENGLQPIKVGKHYNMGDTRSQGHLQPPQEILATRNSKRYNEL